MSQAHAELVKLLAAIEVENYLEHLDHEPPGREEEPPKELTT